jgi:hypothetical protein
MIMIAIILLPFIIIIAIMNIINFPEFGIRHQPTGWQQSATTNTSQETHYVFVTNPAG